MDKFQAFVIFNTVVDHGGFSIAAKKLGMSASAVTKNIGRLEDDLGVMLFNRTTRQIALTDYGRAFHKHCVEILTALDEAESSIRQLGTAPSGRVRLVMPYSFGRVTFTPELPRFVERYPSISLDIHFSDEPVDMIKEGFDLAVLSRELDDSRLVRRILHVGPVIAVASPTYIARYGTPSVPQDLVTHQCIIGPYGSEWTFRHQDQPISVRIAGSIALHNGDAVREAAVAGLGIAQSTWWLFRKELQQGTLIPVLSDYDREGVPISVLYPAKRHISRKTAAVLDFLKEITSISFPYGTSRSAGA